jgi:hypothetical protein
MLCHPKERRFAARDPRESHPGNLDLNRSALLHVMSSSAALDCFGSQGWNPQVRFPLAKVRAHKSETEPW